ncbi:MAG TPA: antibiotic biosynthesis monooxygenase [Candidatus Limnocylindrales bacterium]|nr:antibiotic biosynthesis monooxygenase [Candidatus Limnocylindrales bacterium]
MFVVCNRVKVNPERAEAFEALFLSRAGMVDTMPGFVSFQLLRPAKTDDGYMVMVTWESKEAYHGWIKSAAFKDGHSRTGTLPEDTFLGPQTIELYELLEQTERAG